MARYLIEESNGIAPLGLKGSNYIDIMHLNDHVSEAAPKIFEKIGSGYFRVRDEEIYPYIFDLIETAGKLTKPDDPYRSYSIPEGYQ